MFSSSLGKIVADFNTTLSAAISIGATSATLQSVTDDDGNTIPSGQYLLTIDGGNSAKEYFQCQLDNSTKIVSSIKSISRQGALTTGAARAHRVGATVVLTDFGVLKFVIDLLDGTTGFNSASPLSYDGAPTSITGNQIPTAAWVLAVVNGGTVTFDQQIVSGQLAGETVAVNDVVYFKESDQRWWKADADLTATFDQLQLGICKTAAGAGVAIQVAISGPVSDFTGLTAGSKYYLSNTAGAISTSAGTNSVFIGWALSTTQILFSTFYKTLPSQKEKDAMAGGGNYGTPSSSNKFLTADLMASNTFLPVLRTYTASSLTTLGDSSTRFDITNPGGTTFRYTWDGTGTDPGISAATVPVGTRIAIFSDVINANNQGHFAVTGSGNNYFEVTNASGTAEVDKTIGNGFLKKVAAQTWTKPSGLKYIVVEGVAGGGPGGSVNSDGNAGSGGGAGSYFKKLYAAADLSSTEDFYVGAGISTILSNTAVYGYPTIFKGCTAGGGFIGRNTDDGGFGGTATGGDMNIRGGDGQSSWGSASAPSVSYGGNGGASFFGGGGYGNTSNNEGGQAGRAYGSGGGGAATQGAGTVAGGDGAAGFLIITEYYA